MLVHGGVVSLSGYDRHWLFQPPKDAVAVAVGREGAPVQLRGALGAGAAVLLGNVWSFSAAISAGRGSAAGPAALPAYSAEVAAGLRASFFGSRLRMNVALSLENTAATPRSVFTTPPVLGIGSVQQHGVRRPPLVSFELAERVSLDAYGALWVGVTGGAEALLGATWKL